MPLQYEKSIEIRHDVVRFLFPRLACDIRATPVSIDDQDLHSAGLSSYVERKINANGSRYRLVQLTFLPLLSNSPAFYPEEKKVSRPIERLRIVFRKTYHAFFQ